jgi:hypothetical protein
VKENKFLTKLDSFNYFLITCVRARIYNKVYNRGVGYCVDRKEVESLVETLFFKKKEGDNRENESWVVDPTP